jgi:putative addiction module component (TIGR02574 family)
MTAIDISRLSPLERLELIGALWDSLSPEDFARAPGQEAELARRTTAFEADSFKAAPGEEIEAEGDTRG